MEKLDIVIIGAGVAGIFTSLNIKNKQVTIFEKKSRNKSNLLKRVLVSGNGRCNFFNANIEKFLPSYLNGDYIKKLFNYFDNNGFAYFVNEEGYYYPFFNKSECFYNFLINELNKTNHKIIEEEIICIDYKNRVIKSENRLYSYNKLIIATGGRSYDRDDFSYSLLDSLDIDYHHFSPGLCPIVVKEKIDKKLVDNKIQCFVELFYKNKKIYSEDGGVIFKKDGLSGICIFNCAFHINSLLRKGIKDDIKISLDIFSHNNFYTSLSKSYPSFPKFLLGIKLVNERYLEYTFDSLYDFKSSHTSFGGIDIKEISPELELTRRKDIYAIGEVVDRNYPCGGFNIGMALLESIYLGEIISAK